MKFDLNKVNPALVAKIANQSRLPLIMIAVIVLCYFMVSAVYYIVLAPDFKGGEIKTVRAASGERWAWFTADKKPVKKAPEPTENITESRLNAKLQGIVELGDRSVAIISLGGRQEKNVFGIGDKLKGNTTIEAIEANRVLIREKGQIRSLTMKENDAEGLEVSGDSERDYPAAEGVGKSLNEVAGINAPVLAGVRFVETETGDTGMSLGTISPKMLEGTDLQADDVVLSAGGNSIDQIMASPTSYQSLLRSDSLDITVMRGGEEQIININPRSIAPNVMRMIGQNR